MQKMWGYKLTMDEAFWARVYEKAEMHRLFIQVLRVSLPGYLEIMSMLK